MITPTQIDRVLTIAESYAKSRPLNRISTALIAAGVSILGIENFTPYLLLAIRPELKTIVDLQNNTNTAIALALIVIGAAILPIGLVIKYKTTKFASDTLLFELICNKFPKKAFDYVINDFMTNWSLTNKQVNALDSMADFFDYQVFIIYDDEINIKIKEFWRDLKAFRQSISIKTFPSSDDRFSVPREKRDKSIISELTHDGNGLKSNYNKLYTELIEYRHKSRVLKYFLISNDPPHSLGRQAEPDGPG